MIGSKAEPVRVLLVDDHEVVRVGLQTVLSRQESINVVGEASTVDEAIEQACALKPDVVLMDVRLGGGSGVDACRAIRESCPDTRVLFLTSYQDEEAVLAAVIGGGAWVSVEASQCRGIAARHSFRGPGPIHPGSGHYPASLGPYAVAKRGSVGAAAGVPLFPAAAGAGACG